MSTVVQVPSIGKVVHYVSTDGAHVPADICAVNDDTLTLFIKDPARFRATFEFAVPCDETGAEVGTWHWPEYVPGHAKPKAESVSEEAAT